MKHQQPPVRAPPWPADGPTPEPKGAEVLLRTVACGVCHSDVHLHEGFDLGAVRRYPWPEGASGLNYWRGGGPWPGRRQRDPQGFARGMPLD